MYVAVACVIGVFFGLLVSVCVFFFSFFNLLSDVNSVWDIRSWGLGYEELWMCKLCLIYKQMKKAKNAGLYLFTV